MEQARRRLEISRKEKGVIRRISHGSRIALRDPVFKLSSGIPQISAKSVCDE
jgi:hypothetical protein